MKLFFSIVVLVTMFVSGAATMYFSDALYFEVHTGVTVTEAYAAARLCEEQSQQSCSPVFMPDSFFKSAVIRRNIRDLNWI